MNAFAYICRICGGDHPWQKCGSDCIECDNCGDKTRAWDWSPTYDRFCLECLAIDDDPSADRGDWRFHQDHDQ